MPTISIITITCRAEPRLGAMARALRASLDRAASDVELEWVIVANDPDLAFDAAAAVGALDGARFYVCGVPAPARADGLPAHNSAKNAGLAAARGDYVVFLSDCMLVTQDWVSCAATRARLGQGWRCKQFELVDVNQDQLEKPFNHGAVGQPLSAITPIPATTVGGRCWGAPRAAFLQVQGFDTSFDGEIHGHDVECAIRLGRVGVTFVAPSGACAVRLRRTALPTTNSKEARRGTRNQRLIAQLTKDRDRTLPLRPASFGLESSEAITIPPPEAPLAGGGAGDAPADPAGAAGAAPVASADAGAGPGAPAAAGELELGPLAAPARAAGGAAEPGDGASAGGAGAPAGALPEVPRDPDRRDDLGAQAASMMWPLPVHDQLAVDAFTPPPAPAGPSEMDLSDLDDLLGEP